MTNNNPVSQLALLYKAIEERLRWAAAAKTPFTITELEQTESIKSIAKSPWQVRGLVLTLAGKNFIKNVGRRTGKGSPIEYEWNLKAEPFILGKRIQKAIVTTPSSVVCTKTDIEKPAAMAEKVIQQPVVETKPAHDIEVAFGNTLIIIGKNPETGRIRVTIEQ